MIKTTISEQWNGKDVKIRGKRVVGKSTFEIGLVVEGQAKALVPVHMGRLAGSITTQAARQGTNTEAPATASDRIAAPTDDMETLVGTAVEYGPWVEFGTGPHWPPLAPLKEWARLVLGDESAAYAIALKIAQKGTDAQPYLRPALDLARGKVLTITMKNGRYEFADYLKESGK